MNSPFQSTSFRDFWSNRWNMSVKINLHRIGFQPVMAVLRWISGIKDGEKSPAWHGIFGGMGI
jgi:hypothetical protein